MVWYKRQNGIALRRLENKFDCDPLFAIGLIEVFRQHVCFSAPDGDLHGWTDDEVGSLALISGAKVHISAVVPALIDAGVLRRHEEFGLYVVNHLERFATELALRTLSRNLLGVSRASVEEIRKVLIESKPWMFEETGAGERAKI